MIAQKENPKTMPSVGDRTVLPCGDLRQLWYPLSGLLGYSTVTLPRVAA